MMRDILIATHNPDKLKELEELVNPLKLRLHFLRELPGFYPTEEDQETLQKNAMKKAKDGLYDVVLIDTAGRLAIDAELMEQLEAIKKEV